MKYRTFNGRVKITFPNNSKKVYSFRISERYIPLHLSVEEYIVKNLKPLPLYSEVEVVVGYISPRR